MVPRVLENLPFEYCTKYYVWKKLGGISPDVFTRTKMYGLLRESAGVPLHIEDITKKSLP